MRRIAESSKIARIAGTAKNAGIERPISADGARLNKAQTYEKADKEIMALMAISAILAMV